MAKSEGSDRRNLATRISMTRRKWLGILGGAAGGATVAADQFEGEGEGDLSAGGISSSLTNQKRRQTYVTSPSAATDTSVLKENELFIETDTGLYGVWDGSALTQFPLGTSASPVPSAHIGALSAVDSTAIGASHGVDPSSISIGWLSDIHWSEQERLETLANLKSRMDSFVDEMDSLGVSFCILGGDIGDGVEPGGGQPSETTMVTRIEDALSYLRTQAGSSGTGLSVPLFALPGDHEHANVQTWNMSNIYGALDHKASQTTLNIHTYSDFASSYWSFDLPGWRMIFLNTGNKTADGLTSDSTLTQQQMDWFLGEIETQDRVCLVPHVPIADGYPEQSNKDSFAFQQDVSSALRDVPNSFAINGHVHHHLKEGFDALFDPYGNQSVQTLALTQGEYWATIRLGDDGWRVTPNYSLGSGTSPTLARGPFGSDASYSTGPRPIFEQNSHYRDLRVGNTSIYDSIDSGITQVESWPKVGLQIQTNASANNRKRAHIAEDSFVSTAVDAPRALKIDWVPSTNTQETFNWTWGESFSKNIIGFRGDNGTLSALSAVDGTTETTTTLYDYGTGDRHVLTAEVYNDGGDTKHFFSAAAVIGSTNTRATASHSSATDNVPTGGAIPFRPFQVELTTKEGVAKTHTIRGWKVMGGSQRNG